MYKIKTLNAISDVVTKNLPTKNYEISNDVEDYDAILVRSAKCHEMEFPKSLIAIARAGAGVNNIPLDRCTNEGICVFNTPGANANGVKELVVTGMLVASRNIIEASAWVNSLKGNGDEVPALVEKGKKAFVGPELKGKKLGVIGLGAIGAMVANIGFQLGMEVYGYDPYISIDAAWNLDTRINRSLDVDSIFASCDYITLHIPLLDSTRGFVNEKQFAMMKKGVTLLNFARGELVDTQALFAAIENGTISNYIIDFPNEDMLQHKNIIAIPHLGASTPESEENCADMASQELHSFIEYGNIINSVNMPNCQMPFTSDNRITIIHENTPNMVGQITKILGENNINIENMINQSRKTIAYTILDVGNDVPASVVTALEATPGINKVRTIKH